MFVVGAGGVEGLLVFFEISARDEEVGTVTTNRDGLGVCSKRSGGVFQLHIDTGEIDGEAGVARRVSDSLVEESDQLRLTLVQAGVRDGGLQDAVVFGEGGDERDVLVHRSRIVLQVSERRDEALARERDLVTAILRAERRLL